MPRMPRRADHSSMRRRDRRERRIIDLVAAGRANKEIAAELGVTRWAVEKQLRRLFREFDVPNRAALVSAAVDRGQRRSLGQQKE